MKLWYFALFCVVLNTGNLFHELLSVGFKSGLLSYLFNAMMLSTVWLSAELHIDKSTK